MPHGPAGTGKVAEGSAAALKEENDASDERKVILTPVRLTRHLYAQLAAQRFFPPKIFGQEWQKAVERYAAIKAELSGDRPTGSAGLQISEQERNEVRWRELGAKIACGLEILYASSRSRTRALPLFEAPTESDSTLMDQVERKKFIDALAALGYFEQEREGSERWKKLEASALQKWKEMKKEQNESGAR